MDKFARLNLFRIAVPDFILATEDPSKVSTAF